MDFIGALKSDLQYPPQYHSLFNKIEKAEQLARILKNKDAYVEKRIQSSNILLEGDFQEGCLKRRGIIRTTSIGEMIVEKAFALKGSFRNFDIVIKGPAAFEKNVTIARSVVLGPAFVSEGSKVFDSRIRGLNGAVYIGCNCVLWDHTVIIRSFIGDNSLIHTCNVDDSIVGPDSNFGGTEMRSTPKLHRATKLDSQYETKLERRVILANYSFGNKIKVADPVTGSVVQTESDHFGTIAGSGVWLASGTIVYPGTIIGSGASINTTLPIVGYIPPGAKYSLFLVITKNNKDGKKIKLSGSLRQQIRKYFRS